jgi:NAD-dependent SIR2 family protein deacetylase
LNDQNAVLFLENILLRERMDLKAWDTRQMKKNMATMKTVTEKATWAPNESKVVAKLNEEIDKLSVIIQNLDATLVDAGHTHLEQAVTELRKLVFGF